MRDTLLAVHVVSAAVALLITLSQILIGARLRLAATAERLLRWNRLLAAMAIALTLVIVLVAGAGFALLGGHWQPTDPWVASALVQALVLLIGAIGVVIPATQRITDQAREDPVARAAQARDPLLAALLTTQPALLLGIASLMVNKPPLAGALEIPGAVLAFGFVAWLVWRGRRDRTDASMIRRVLAWATGLAVVLAGTAGIVEWRSSVSRLPAAVSMTPAGGHMAHMGSGTGTSLTTLNASPSRAPVREFTVTAEPAPLTPAGRSRTVWRLRTGQGGSEIRVVQGTQVVVHLVNHLPVPTSIHWHGVDVPASQDGVAGVTQDAVRPGRTFTYRFIADRAGTYWYHSHQDSVHQVQAGLYGALIVVPPGGVGADADQTVQIHTWRDGPTTLDGELSSIGPQRSVRLRVINTDSVVRRVTLVGAPFRVAAIDGSEIAGGATMTGTALNIPGGGRYDLVFTPPGTGTAWLEVRNGAGHAVSPVGPRSGKAPEPGPLRDFDLTRYGRRSSGELTLATRFTRNYTVHLDASYGWYDGHFGLHYTMNGALFPDGPMLNVSKGDLVKITIMNRTRVDHPMHLHGHHFTVLAKEGKPLSGAPMVLDTMNVAPFETWTVGFRADNPGLWMFHCHNLSHASNGMDMMVAYDNVTTPYLIGDRSGNHPE